jgi:hypothetical protein
MSLWFESQRVARTLPHCPQNFTVAGEWAMGGSVEHGESTRARSFGRGLPEGE